MEKKVLVVIGFILLGFLTFGASPLQASSVDGHPEEVEYTGEDPSDTIRVTEVLEAPTSEHPASGHDATHVEGKVQSADTHNGKDTHGVKSHETQSEDNASQASLGHEREIPENNRSGAEHQTQESHKPSIKQTDSGHSRAAGFKSGFSLNTWIIVGVALLVIGSFVIFFMKGNSSMKNLKLRTKIIGMVGFVLVLMVVSAVFGIIKIRNVGEEIKGIAEEDIPLTGVITEITVNQLEQAVWFERALRFGEVLAAKEEALRGLKNAEEQFEERTKLVDEALKQGEKIAEHAAKTAATDEARREFEEANEHLKAIKKQHAGYEDHAHQIFSLIHQGKLHEAEALAEKVEKEEEELDHDLEQFLRKIEKFAAEASLTAEHDEQSAEFGMLAISFITVIIGLTLSIFITRSITKPINRIIEGLNDGAEQVASASGQVSAASQQLAEGSSEQAASIEETSSSLEEMSSMTKQNADNSGQADNLMKEANQVVGQANQSMVELTGSMQEISKASEETSKIIKTIDEIAFQTNLLALNAAVEAARAGEAGAGFAVVADEVRNLAMRAADAAKNTADLIEGTVKKVNDGTKLVSRTNEAFTEVAASTSKVGELVGEIAAASNEQAQGIEQTNTAVSEMDKVTQSNAANAEETASASEEMNAQAEQMMAYVKELVALVGGSGKGAKKSSAAKLEASRKASYEAFAVAAPLKKSPSKTPSVHRTKEVDPEQMIPMDDGDFKDF